MRASGGACKRLYIRIACCRFADDTCKRHYAFQDVLQADIKVSLGKSKKKIPGFDTLLESMIRSISTLMTIYTEGK